MIQPKERTRFLPTLDQFVAQDRSGAIMDMLQVLREHGVVATAQAAAAVDPNWVDDEDYKDHVKRDLGAQIGLLATEEAALERTKLPGQGALDESFILQAGFIRKDKI